LAAREQIGVSDAAGARPIEFGKKRTARVGRDRGDRPEPRTEAETMQRQRRLGLGVARHGTSVRHCYFADDRREILQISGIPTRH
jgi:hypothetical protein